MASNLTGSVKRKADFEGLAFSRQGAVIDSTASYKTAMERPALFNTEEAATYLGITRGTLEVWRSTKRYPIPHIKIGRLVRYRKSVLDDFLASRTVGA